MPCHRETAANARDAAPAGESWGPMGVETNPKNHAAGGYTPRSHRHARGHVPSACDGTLASCSVNQSCDINCLLFVRGVVEVAGREARHHQFHTRSASTQAPPVRVTMSRSFVLKVIAQLVSPGECALPHKWGVSAFPCWS